MAHRELVEELKAAGYDPQILQGAGVDFVAFKYRVPIGELAGEEVLVALTAPDWPINPPGGPHVSPRIHHPGDNNHHQSPLGPTWIYWSRPHPRWADGDRSLEEYLTHMRTLFAQFVEPAA